MKIKRIDHIGIVVNDLPAAKEFFLDCGLELAGEGNVEGDWVGRVIGLKDVKAAIVILKTHGGDANIELSKFYNPPAENDIQHAPSNTYGIRHISFEVDDVDSLVAKLQKKSTKLIGAIENYKNIYKLCYINGPEGIILELAEKIK